MLMHVLPDNLLLLSISWKLVGVCSFLLIVFYLDKTRPPQAATPAFIPAHPA